MSAKTKPAKPGSKYGPPAMMTDTVDAMRRLRYPIADEVRSEAEITADDWSSLKALFGRVLHAPLFHLIGHIHRSENYRAIFEATIETPYHRIREQYQEIAATEFPGVCLSALRSGDAAFFRHVADCIDANLEPKKSKRIHAPFQTVCMQLYRSAQIDKYLESRQPGKRKESMAVVEREVDLVKPHWTNLIAVLRAMKLKDVEKLVPGFLRRDEDDQRNQIETAWRKLGRPFAQKRK